MINNKFRLLLVIIFPLFAGILLSTIFKMQPVQAANLIVNTVTDENDGCTVGNCSLREAIIEANNNDTITFDLPVNSTILLSGTQLPTINGNLTIDGSTAVSLTISGNNQSRVFKVGLGAVLTITHLTISNARTDWGSGIFNEGTLTINNSTLSGNSATDDGGAIYNRGILTITNSTLFNNSAEFKAGGILNQNGDIHLSQSRIISNSAPSGGGIYSGGSGKVINVTIDNSILQDNSAVAGAGIFNSGIWNGSGNITVTYSTFSENFASEKGGGIHNDGNSGYAQIFISESTFNNNFAANGGGINNYSYDNYSAEVIIHNSSFSQNSGYYLGGGILNWGEASHVTLINSTFSENSSDIGGGIFNTENGELILRNSIIANSIDGKDCQSAGITTIVASNNIIEGTGWNACELTNGVSNNIIGYDPKLGPLADNGGQTLTHALLFGSLAIDGGDNATCLDIDQRGISRPVDGDNNGSTICDIGAIEAPSLLNLNEKVFLPIILKP